MTICEREGFLGRAFCWSFLALSLSSLTRIVPNGFKVLFFTSSVVLGLALLSISFNELRRSHNDYVKQDSWKNVESLLWPWVGLFALYALSGFWSVGSFETFGLNLYEYRTLLAIPLFTLCLVTASANVKYLEAFFLIGVIFGCALLYGNYILNLLAISAGVFVPRGSHIIGGTISAFGIVLTLHLASRSNNIKKWLLIVCSVMLSIFVLAIDTGRTGYLQVISVWVLWIFCGTVRSKLQALSGLFVVVLAILVFSDSTAFRVGEVLVDVNRFKSGDIASSSGLRLEAWRFSIHQFFKAPILGHGLGSYQVLLSESYDNGLFRWRTDNLHTELGNTIIIGGGVALFLLLAICMSPIKLLFKTKVGCDVIFLVLGVSTVFIVNAIFNSTFKDFGEKHLIMVMFPYLYIHLIGSIK